jgi:hypothetical protein
MKGNPPALLLTGRHQNKRYRVDAHGVRMWLPHGQFAALFKLAAARLTPNGPALRLPKATISRLRRTLARAATRAGIKDEMILTVRKQQFALLSDAIARDQTIHNLLLCDCVDRADVDPILQAARLVETE